MEDYITFAKFTISLIIGTITRLLGGGDELLTLLMVLIVADLVSGFAQAVYNKEVNLTIMFWGGIKKIAILLVVFIGVEIEKSFLVTVPLREITIVYYIVIEGLSFIENIGHFTTLPPQFITFFESLNNKNEGE